MKISKNRKALCSREKPHIHMGEDGMGFYWTAISSWHYWDLYTYLVFLIDDIRELSQEYEQSP